MPAGHELRAHAAHHDGGLLYRTQSFDTAQLTRLDAPIILSLVPIFIGLLFILTIKLRKSPFDLSYSHHAHQELVKGITTEMSGRTLAKIEVLHWCESILFLMWVGMFFIWNSPVSIALAVAVVALTWFFEVWIDNNFARVKWQACLKSAWLVALVMGVVNLVLRPYHPVYLRRHLKGGANYGLLIQIAMADPLRRVELQRLRHRGARFADARSMTSSALASSTPVIPSTRTSSW